MSTFSHSLNAIYDSLNQCVAVTIPAHTLAESLVPTADHFDRLERSVEDAATSRSGIDEMPPSVQPAVHNESVDVLARNLGGIEITVTPAALLQFAHDLLATAIDHSIVGRTALGDLTAAANLIGRVQGDEARTAAIHDRSIRTIPRQIPVTPPVRVA